MSVDAARGDLNEGSAWRLAGWLSLAAVPLLAWKAAVAAAAGGLSGALALFLAALTLLAAAIFFTLGLILGAAGRGLRNRDGGAVTTVATWFTIGLIIDTLVGLLAASYLAQVAAALGDAQTGGFWTDISWRDALLFMVFSLGGGVAAASAAVIYRIRG